MANQNRPETLPSLLKSLTTVTMCLAAVGLILGLFLLTITWNLPLEEEAHPEDEDPLPNYGNFFRFLGIVFTVFAAIGLGGSLLIYKRRKLGWLGLVGVYGSGFVGCLYLIYRLLLMIHEYDSNLLLLGIIRSPIPYLMVWGGIALVILFHKHTLHYIFGNPS